MDLSFYNHWCQIFASSLKKDFGLDDLDCAAILGNAGHESNGFQSLQELKPLVPGSRGGYGIMQWTGPRRKDFEGYCKRNNLNPADMDSQYKFLFVELKGPEGRVIPKLKKAQGLNLKTQTFCETFLRPGIVHMDSRLIWAQRALKAIQSSSVVPDVPVSTPIQNVPQEQAKNTGTSFLDLLISILKALLGK